MPIAPEPGRKNGRPGLAADATSTTIGDANTCSRSLKNNCSRAALALFWHPRCTPWPGTDPREEAPMRILLLAVSLALLASTGLAARAQSGSVRAVTWNQSSPLEVKRYALDACLNRAQVRVVTDDGTVVEGKISDVSSQDFTVARERLAPATVPFASVRSI